MTTRDFTANVISATKVVPDGNFKNSKASGVWDINEVLDLIKGSNWPNAANFPPESFVDGLFSIDLYAGTGSSQQITNNLDLSGSGGLVWTKTRESGATNNHNLQDTVNGVTKYLQSNNSNAQQTRSDLITSFNSDGFTLGADASLGTANFNGNGGYVAWSWRKQPKFFDFVTYSGSGSGVKTISHNLGSAPGMMIVKKISGSGNWLVWHKDLTNTHDKYLHLNETDAEQNYDNIWGPNGYSPDSSEFKVQHIANESGTYVAYLFANNNDDGGFGEPGDQDIIKCDTYTGNGSSTGPIVTLGFEPQFIMLKRTDSNTNANWFVFDDMRGIATGGDDPYLYWNTTAAEVAGNAIEVTPTGFQLKSTSTAFNGSSAKYIYMAIRRGGMQTPSTPSDVFAINTTGTNDSPNNNFTVGFDPDLSLNTQTNGNQRYLVTRLLGNGSLKANADSAFSTHSSSFFGNPSGTIDLNTNFWGTASNVISWSWKRARGYFDIVTYTGNDTNRTISHNLGVAPEMMWVKDRGRTQNWAVYHANNTSEPATDRLRLNENGATVDDNTYWNDTQPTSSVFSVGTDGDVNTSGETYIAYLFATVAGVSKVGSFTYAGSPLNVDCGFSNGAKFILIKESSSAGDWLIFDTTQGIVSGNDPFIVLNDTSSQYTTYDVIDPLSSGFTVAGVLDQATYIFYAIATDPS